MKKIVLLFFVAVTVSAANAQNVQLHYDLGRYLYDDDFNGRPLFTSTVEMFKPDKWGSTFFFIDMDYKSTGVASAYWEFERELKFWSGPLSVHLEYDGGLAYVSNSYFLGATYSSNSADFSKGFTFSALYRYIQKQSYDKPHNFQFTGTWYMYFGQKRTCSFAGFFDFWHEKNPNGNYIFISEPQFWVHLNKLAGFDDAFNLSIGTEVELSYNFAARDGFYAIPTAAIKWDF
ncbi:MAG: DUF5020 family protein [Tannerella sp.]|jgi:hypothetical protein|nr:DUF5020 family protein [Tannerella sp.]